MTAVLNPITLIACKQKVGAEDADKIALPVLIHLDCAKRGVCTAPGANFLTTHLIIASYIASRTKSQLFHDIVTGAYAALGRAADRPTVLLDLTTAEYQLIRTAFRWYLRAIPSVEVGVMAEACAAAERMMA